MQITTETRASDQRHRPAEPIQITYGNHPTPFGSALIAFTPLGLCHLDFFDDDGIIALAQLCKNWPHANLCEDHSVTSPLIKKMFTPLSQQSSPPLRLHLRGTDLQLKVWQKLLAIPFGTLISYRELAQRVGHPAAVRAVGRAVGQNPICYLIPCHRVIRSDGSIGGYRSGIARKKTLLASEAAQREPDTDTPT